MIRVLLSIAVPFQDLIAPENPTHRFINHQALAILRADSRHREADWLQSQIEPFCAGCDWADTGWKNASHMYDPKTGRGQMGLPSAIQMLREYIDVALRRRAEQDDGHTAFYLGAAAHLVQDLCVPHHAAVTLWRGHRAFEDWAAEHRHQFAVDQGGLYDLAETPEGWAVANAEYALANWSDSLRRRRSDRRGVLLPLRRPRFEAPVSDLLPRAQRTTAGFVAYFLRPLISPA